MRLIYTLAIYLLTPLALLRALWRSRLDPEHRRRWAERLGWGPRVPAGGVWLHAVSVGETRAALPLIRALRARYPDLPLLVTSTTVTGSRQVREALGGEVHHCYLPYDLPGAVQRFVRRTRPRLGVVMETELWPNLFAACGREGVGLIVANARLSARSARGYARFRGFTAAVLGRVGGIAAQGEADAQRFIALGADPGRVSVAGNIKYDLEVPDELAVRAAALRRELGADRPVLVAASTHAGEDEQLLEAAARLRERHPGLLLVLVPRHPERFQAVAELCRRRGQRVARRSRGERCDAGVGVYVGDTMGELLLLMAAADVAFVGGSLVATGGHNVLEPAALGKPVIFGPHMFNFAEASTRLLEAGAAAQVDGAAALARAVALWLDDPAAASRAGAAGRALVAANRGALQRLLALIERQLPDPQRGL